MTRAYWFVFRVLILVAALSLSCATTHIVAGACDPVVSEVQTIVALFAPSDWQTKVNKYISDGHAACKVMAAVDQVLAGQALTASKAQSLPADTLDHMRTWKTAQQ